MLVFSRVPMNFKKGSQFAAVMEDWGCPQKTWGPLFRACASNGLLTTWYCTVYCLRSFSVGCSTVWTLFIRRKKSTLSYFRLGDVSLLPFVCSIAPGQLSCSDCDLCSKSLKSVKKKDNKSFSIILCKVHKSAHNVSKCYVFNVVAIVMNFFLYLCIKKYICIILKVYSIWSQIKHFGLLCFPSVSLPPCEVFFFFLKKTTTFECIPNNSGEKRTWSWNTRHSPTLQDKTSKS